MRVTRSFIHKKLGTMHEPIVFEVTARIDDDGEPRVMVTMDGNSLPENSSEAIFVHGLQTLTDTYAGLNLADGQAAIATRYTKLITGDVTIRGVGVDNITLICRRLCRAWFKNDCNNNPDSDTTPEQWKTYLGKESKERNVFLDAVIASNQDVFEKRAKKIIAENKKTLSVEIDTSALFANGGSETDPENNADEK